MTERVHYEGCVLATMQNVREPYGLIYDASIVVEGERIVWCGPRTDRPSSYAAERTIDLGGRLVTPALIDCHTHLVYGGNRAREFERRLQGATYEEIAFEGGGINATVTATREASDQELLASALRRADRLIAEGVRVIEIKSGYGLTISDEIRMLRIARRIEKERPVSVKTTWLAAHAVPPEYENRSDAYIDEVVLPGLKRAHEEQLVDSVDGFCEAIAFSPAQIERVLDAAKRLSLPVKLHAEQLTDQKGALLVARHHGLSADHLEYLSADDIPAFSASGAVAVLLPGAFYVLKEKKRPPVERLREAGVPMAVATDCNPGSSPITSILTVMNMACTFFGLTPEEALAGTTCHAAKALGIDGDHGTIAPHMYAEFAVWDLEHPSELSYEIGASPLHTVCSHRAQS
ncbi:MAG: imidazolonepropionase [Pseudomonadota bacterium]